MRCKEHLPDLSSTVGVCATCLRERLSSLIQAQSHLQTSSEDPNFSDHYQNKPQPLIFPRSASPYITRRKSDHQTNKQIIQRFHSTPLVGPTLEKKNSSKAAGTFDLMAKLFRSKSSDVATSTSSIGAGPAELTRCRNRGMSPENEFNDPEESTYFDSPSTAARTRPSPGRAKRSPGRLASYAFCLSPLVRASPASGYHWSSGGEPSFSGEIRSGKGVSQGGGNYSKNGGVINSKKPNIGEAASYCANRSRKLADIGRLNRNR